MSRATILTRGATLAGAMAPSGLVNPLARWREQRCVVSCGVFLPGCLAIPLATLNDNFSAFLRRASEMPVVLAGILLAAVGVLAGCAWWQRRAKEALAEAHARLDVETRERAAVLTEQNEKLREEVAERRRNESRLIENQARLSLVNAIATATISGMPGEQVIEQALRQTAAQFPDLRVAYSTIDENSTLKAAHGAGVQPRGQPLAVLMNLNQAPGYLQRLRLGETVAVQDVEREPCLAPLAEVFVAAEARSFVAAPLEHGGRLAALLCFESAKPRVWTGHEKTALEQVAGFLKAAVPVAKSRQERTQAEAALRAERDHSEAIIEGNPAIICGIDPQGRTTYINPAGERITGYRAEEIVGENWWQLFFSGDNELHSKLWMEELKKGEIRDHEMVLTARSGQKRIISWNSICFRNDDGEVIEIIGFGNDITRRKQLEEQLRQSQKMEAVGRLAGGVAHDFNNLLTVISGYSDLILEDLDSDNAIHSDVEEILKASDRAAALTRQLLAFSRRQVLKPKLINLGSVVADSERMLRRLIGEDIDLVTLLDSGIGAVRADPGQIEQVILNLAVNARDAMPQGGCITIATRNVDLDDAFVARHPHAQTGPHVLLAFGDTGVGMDEETRSRVFEPFFTTKEPGKGTGLGLSTVYGIVKQSGGVIWVESGAEGGTQFNICLPRVDEPADDGAAMAPAVGQQRGTETILLVEDEPSVRVMVRRILQGEGYDVLEACEGQEAFEIAARDGQSIRLLLTDIVMPRMGGRELAERLAPIHPEMKVVYMTGYTEQAISDAPFLHKPFTPKGLLSKLREVLDTPEARGQAAVSSS